MPMDLGFLPHVAAATRAGRPAALTSLFTCRTINAMWT